MSSFDDRLQRRAEDAQQAGRRYLGEVGSMLVDAARRSDTVTGLGIDDRINLMHSLVDMWIKGVATMAQTLLTNPAGARWESLEDCHPLPSEGIKVAPTDHPRTISTVGPFQRVGVPGSIIPPSAIQFTPNPLPEGASEFHITLRDYEYVGANYRGKVRLTPVGPRSVLSANEMLDEPEVIVGL